MDFNLSEEQRAIQEMVRQFAEREIAPNAHEWEEKEIFPREVIKKMGELGFFGCLLPEEYGGTDYGFLSMCLITEELAKVSSGLRGAMNMQCVGTALNILEHGLPETRKKYIPSLIKAEKMGCFAMTEPDAGSDVFSMKTHAVYENNYYILNGTKMWVSYGQVADIAIIYAYTDREAKGKGLSAFVVELHSKGVSTSGIHKMGTHSYPTGEIVLEDVKVPKRNLLGNLGDGAKIMFNSLPDTRLGVAAGAVGLSQACLDDAIKYCNERQQFGTPVGQFQMSPVLIADVATSVEAARLLVYRAASQKDEGLRNNALECSYAKKFAAEVAVQAADANMDIHSAYGYSSEYAASRYYREAKMYQIVEGTTNIHRIIIALDRLGIRKANR